MATQGEHTIIYDQNCPMCSWYTGKFVALGILDQSERVSSAEMEAKGLDSKIDMGRARIEVPLINLQTGTVNYGIDSMVEILSVKLPFIKLLMRIPLVKPFFRQLYFIISYNRQVIAGTHLQEQNNPLKPDFSLSYWAAYIITAITISILISAWLGAVAAAYLHTPVSISQSLLIVGSGWIIQIISALIFMNGQIRRDYLAHLATIMLVGVLVLVPGNLLSPLFGYTQTWIPVISVLFSSLIMLKQHIHRIRAIRQSQLWTGLWFIYLQSTALFWLWKFGFLNFTL